MNSESSPATRTNKLGFVTSLIGLIPVGLGLSIAALMQIDQSKGALGGKRLAIGSVFLNLFWILVLCVTVMVIMPNRQATKLRAKSIEARAFLKGLGAAQEGFRVKYGGYAPLRPTPHSPGNVTALPWDSKPCPKACRPGNSQACTEFSCLAYGPDRKVHYQYACAVQPKDTKNAAQLSCGARADLNGDGVNGSFTYRSGMSKTRTSTLADGISECKPALPLPLDVVVDCKPNNI